VASAAQLGRQAPALERQPAADPDSAEVHRLAKQVELLQAQMVRLRAEGAHNAIPSEPSSNGTEVDTSGPRDVERQREEWHAHMLEISSAFESEDIVALWANQMSSKIRDVFVNTDALRGLNPKVECRSRTCRVSMTDDGSKGARAVRVLTEWDPELSMAQIDWVREANSLLWIRQRGASRVGPRSLRRT